MPETRTRIPDAIRNHEAELLAEWAEAQSGSLSARGRLSHDELRKDCRAFLAGLREATRDGHVSDTSDPEWERVREFLARLSRQRTSHKFTPTETATFVFSLKQPLFKALRSEYPNDPEGLIADLWTATVMLDSLGLFTTEKFQESREEIISRHQQEMLELSTPVVRLWDGVLALPLIGTLDSARTQIVMQNLLQAIVDTGASIAIIDITGVPTVDTLTAQHLLKTVAAARLMGADCIISGIRPQIAQTIIHLGVELLDVTTKATLADAFQLALRRLGLSIAKQVK